jgi:hypothetical protein
VPAIFEVREFVLAGGLLSYGASISEAYRKAGIYTGKAGIRPPAEFVTGTTLTGRGLLACLVQVGPSTFAF